MLTFSFSGADGKMTVPELLTSGMAGKEVLLKFSPEWENLTKTVVFSNGEVSRDVIFRENPMTIPPEVLEKPLQILTVGVWGVGSEGRVVIPTIRAQGPRILPGAVLSGDLSSDPEPEIWAQILALLGDLSALETEARDNLVAAINELADKAGTGAGGFFIPSVSADGWVRWTNNVGAPNPAPVNMMGPAGPSGADGTSAVHSWDGTVLTVSSAGGTSSADLRGPQGDPGPQGINWRGEWQEYDTYTQGDAVNFDGLVYVCTTLQVPDGMAPERGSEDWGLLAEPGYSPLRGTDYWTEADKAEIKGYVDAAILGGAW